MLQSLSERAANAAGTAALLLACLALSGGNAVLARQSADKAGPYLPAMIQAKETLFLEVFINDYRIGKLASFHRYADGCLTIASEDLREFDLKVPDEAIHDGGICLERMPGVTYRYDAAGQTIHFAVTDEARVPLVLDARRRRPEMAPAQE